MGEYQALYRKWRPMTFDDVVGQSHVTDTIKNEVALGNIGHAFLFCGSRGTGKTSTARIFARAINCENPREGNPCNECETCRGILSGAVMDVIEIDAASHSGVDNMRLLRDEANYSAAACRYKVYIIDEVHALSSGAFNALLKLLEEPPAHVKFVLATTEANKVLETISSRCQRFDFKRITKEDIMTRLCYICSEEGINIEDAAIDMLAIAADGSLRDALSCLEPCVGRDKIVVTAKVADFLGMADMGAVMQACCAVAQSDAAQALAAVEAVCARGKNLFPYIESLTAALRDILVICVTGDSSLTRSAASKEELTRCAALFSPERAVCAIRALGEAASAARYCANARVVFEAALLRLCYLREGNDIDSLLARIGELERRLAEGVVVASPQKQKNKPSAPKRTPKTAAPEFNLDAVRAAWKEIISAAAKAAKLQLFAALESAALRDADGKLAIVYPTDGGSALRDMTTPDISWLRETILDKSGIDVEVVVKLDCDFDFENQDVTDPFEEVASRPYVDNI